MQRLQKIITWTVLTSELSHVFCCVLPTVVSILTLLSGMGVLTVMPTSLLFLHDMIHAWEIPMIVTSGFLLFAGWGLYFLSLKLDCADTGCAHPPCTPAKKRSSKFLMIATCLFVVNVSVYFFVHRGVAPTETHHIEHHRDAHGHSHVDHSH